MTDVTDFDWHKMIVFGPYTSREEMEKKVITRDEARFHVEGKKLIQSSE